MELITQATGALAMANDNSWQLIKLSPEYFMTDADNESLFEQDIEVAES